MRVPMRKQVRSHFVRSYFQFRFSLCVSSSLCISLGIHACAVSSPLLPTEFDLSKSDQMFGVVKVFTVAVKFRIAWIEKFALLEFATLLYADYLLTSTTMWDFAGLKYSVISNGSG